MALTDPPTTAAVQQRLVAWQRRYGRNELPWQRPATPYRVWVSEIMLQQTRVETVVPYFERFMAHFPDVERLAAAERDAVLALWAGLGYYARARNLHAAAGRIAAEHAGALPQGLAELQQLPGIGASTAGAIRSLGHGLPAPILDGNAKRIFARLGAVPGWPGHTATARRLWRLAEALTPADERCAPFNQGLMDLGSLVCTPRAPACADCPLAFACAARAEGRPEAYPGRRPPRRRPLRTTRLLLIEGEAGVLLQQRPPAGVWGGLWSLPECPEAGDPAACARALGVVTDAGRALEPRYHAFTHFELRMLPVRLRYLDDAPAAREEGQPLRWYRPGSEPAPALAAPIQRLLAEASRDEGG